MVSLYGLEGLGFRVLGCRYDSCGWQGPRDPTGYTGMIRGLRGGRFRGHGSYPSRSTRRGTTKITIRPLKKVLLPF